MTIDQFKFLDETRQAEILLKEGVFLSDRIYKNFTIFLYQFGKFYVEVFYNTTYSILQGTRCFEYNEDLQPYLERIDISALYK